MFKCFKKRIRQRYLLKIMKEENSNVRKYCAIRDWDNAKLWLDRNKMTFKAFRKIQNL